MTRSRRERWWRPLPRGVREQADGQVLQDARLRPVRVVREAGRVHGLGLTPDGEAPRPRRS
ncbi:MULTISPECIES: hypothetical protein [unclassified Streptomyces]|uniref:hypothetical protein n=1 Tax=unclassified Streptomyces TaxID=2593676 RepID=UPI0033B94715